MSCPVGVNTLDNISGPLVLGNRIRSRFPAPSEVSSDQAGLSTGSLKIANGLPSGAPEIDGFGAPHETIDSPDCARQMAAVSLGVFSGRVAGGDSTILEQRPANSCKANQGKSAPRYVRACQSASWAITTWKKLGGQKRVCVYRCGSWRCRGECLKKSGALWYARIKVALESVRADSICFLVFTLNPADWKASGKFSAIDQMYRGTHRLWKKLHSRLERELGEKLKYVTVVEQHQSTRPHFNVAVSSMVMASWLLRSPDWKRDWLELNAEQCGFGRICFAEVAKNSDAIAGYIVKVAGGAKQAVVGEISKLSQLPISAPLGFRRIRSSRGFLPKKFKDEDLTGRLDLVPAHAVESALPEVEKVLERRRAAGAERAAAALEREGEVKIDRETGEVIEFRFDFERCGK